MIATHVFYNNSAHDGDADASAADDNAIATDKLPLPAGGTTTFANYTNYDKGINGIMIDVENLAPPPPAESDFGFTVGNDDAPGDWAVATAPTSITVRQGAGFGGSDRITIIWADGAISNTWLRITINAGGNIGLASDCVFYYGNAVGDVGDRATDAIVNASDVLAILASPTASGAALVTDENDINRDMSVNATDVLKTRGNPTSTQTALQLITP